MKNLKGKTCLITGAASGIGRALAHGLAAEGMKLFLADIDEMGLAEAKAEVEARGAPVFSARCDVSSHEDLSRLAEAFYAELGDVDLLVNNAGVASAGFLEDLNREEWEYAMNVNAWSVIHAIRVFLPRMLERGEGHIVNTASGAGIVGIPYHAPYIASKFTVVGISEALYSELKHAHKGIDVSVICPTFLKTNIIARTPISVPRSLLQGMDAGEVETKMEEFKTVFWEKYTRGAPPLDKVVRKYIRGIKSGKLYVFDTPRLRAAMAIKGTCEPLYRAVLRSEGRKNLDMILRSMAEIGVEVAGER